jgi:ribonuclease HII
MLLNNSSELRPEPSAIVVSVISSLEHAEQNMKYDFYHGSSDWAYLLWARHARLVNMILGIDEVGRGCWAGPVVAGAVILRESIPGLADSKKLTKLQRERLDAQIRLDAVAIGLGWVTSAEVDSIGLTEAVRLAMARAVAEIPQGQGYDELIIDGNYNFLLNNPKSRCLIKADDTVPSVSAASIVAKVARDAYMSNASLDYPGYHFEKHVGYGTAAHLAALKIQGVCDLHRRSFAPIRAILAAV